MKTCTVCVISWNGLAYNKKLYESFARFTGSHITLLWVDNGSTDGTVEWLWDTKLQDDRMRVLLLEENHGVGKARNLGIATIDTDAFCMLDNDMRVTQHGWIDQLMQVLESDTHIGAVAPSINLLLDSTMTFTQPVDPNWSRLNKYRNARNRVAVFTAEEDVQPWIDHYLTILKQEPFQSIINCEGGGTTMWKETWDSIGGYPDWGLAFHEGAYLKDEIKDMGLQMWVVPYVFMFHYAHGTVNIDFPYDIPRINGIARRKRDEWRKSRDIS